MAAPFWDASALAKYYISEEGSDSVAAVFEQVPIRSMATSVWSYAETFAILLRRRNAKIITDAVFTKTADQLREQIVDNADMQVLSVLDADVFASLAVMRRHNLNSTDAAILAMLLRTLPSPVPPDFVLVAADKRLLRAANAEGMKTLDPAALPAPDVAAFLAALDAEALADAPAENGTGNQGETDR